MNKRSSIGLALILLAAADLTVSCGRREAARVGHGAGQPKEVRGRRMTRHRPGVPGREKTC